MNADLPRRAKSDGPAGRTTVPTSADPVGSRALRYVADIIELHERLSYRQLPAEITGTPIYHAQDPHSGLVTLTARDSQFPTRYLRGILGFRLAQYLRLSWISADLVYRTAAYHEPLPRPGGLESIHTVTLCSRTGRIRGYVGLSCSTDAVSLPLDSPRRALFPTETAHGIDLLGQYARPGLGTHQAFELKRFLRDQAMPLGIQHDRVPWHLMLGMGEAMVQLGDSIRLVLGDAKEHVALRHLRLAGFDLRVVEGTDPSLPPSDPLAPIYRQDVLAKPFVAPVPDDLPWYADVVRSYLDGTSDLTSYHAMVARLAARRQRTDGPLIPRQRGGTA
ncbi:hypothetical protein [Streptomyces nitrosporeus]|uniref:Uncharacterized protein n=1 Tax=Streptomyces nitrosporeus TaxID=28894 RepID=A0A5J6FFY8_9ACTN|nr:hypothetical protein [Streptomyces nitrosporeus]QEU75053.1 hypothetical protein CP967_26430 [Streptomyces nitrosporeus]GGY91348.1 hypothetical protein GCM10010327_22570 [Streptomyces nitrosporeus]